MAPCLLVTKSSPHSGGGSEKNTQLVGLVLKVALFCYWTTVESGIKIDNSTIFLGNGVLGVSLSVYTTIYYCCIYFHICSQSAVLLFRFFSEPPTEGLNLVTNRHGAI